MIFVFTLMEGLYLLASILLLIYGINAYVLIALSTRGRDVSKPFLPPPDGWPAVTVQIPVYNEKNVVERIIRAAAALDYPPDKLEIQVLDDSDDQTSELIALAKDSLAAAGRAITVLRRKNRTGFKAGALAAGMESAGGEILAIFDADFIPPADFLRKTVPFFLTKSDLGFIQTRWDHLNREDNVLTRCLSLGIDGHFWIEQPARARNGLLMNFNGTAGLWRRSAVEEAGGWSGRTLTEDLDLSYRAQLAGWKALYLRDVTVPCELPGTIAALKSQQFRWAKGSIQTAGALLPGVWKSSFGLFPKLQASLHLTNYLVHPLMLTVAALAFPLLSFDRFNRWEGLFAASLLPLIAATLGPTAMYVTASVRNSNRLSRTLLRIPPLLIYGTGLAVSNSRAVFEAAIGKSSAFIRTPKKGESRRSGYRLRHSRVWPAEIILGLFTFAAIPSASRGGHYGIVPFLALFTAAFLTVGLRTALSLARDA